ncbi:MAG: flagellar biosynthesis protein FlhF [Burkholderiales bacterium]|nr:flagellar biosynthesis protein FlhF [Burkholderiales bacterium]
MLMRKFLGATAREAMQKMKTELGPEALVISNRKTAGGVESLARVEQPAAAVAAPPAPAAVPASRRDEMPEPPAPARPAAARNPGRFTSLKEFAPRVEPQGPLPAQAGSAAYAAVGGEPSPTLWPAGGRSAAGAAAPARESAADAAARARDERVLAELAAVKGLLQDQIAGQAWRDMRERRPLAVKLWRELSEAGFSAGLARAVADKLPDDLTEAQARKWLADVLTRNLRCADAARDIVEAGGVYALVGPTGVGKTTTTAKLAARCVVRYGAQSLGLITTDSYRIGAFDQLAIYGKILGVPVHSAQSYAELEATLATMAGKRMVLIDTTGMGQRDSRVGEQINLLNNPGIRRVLLVNAAAQAETLEDVARSYQGKAAGARPLFGAILTKIDEAAKLGPALDVLARHGIELFGVTNGQRVPEDLHAPAGAALVHRALKATTDPAFAWRDDEVIPRALARAADGAAGLAVLA